jgi:hypothetical protein
VQVETPACGAIAQLRREDSAARRCVRQIDAQVAIKPAGADHRRIEMRDVVRRGDDDEITNAAIRLETGEQLVDGTSFL